MNFNRDNSIVSLENLFCKDYHFISSEDALRDVIPPKWNKDVLEGKSKVKIGMGYPVVS